MSGLSVILLFWLSIRFGDNGCQSSDWSVEWCYPLSGKKVIRGGESVGSSNALGKTAAKLNQ
jgi:hypothetical protein